jgi:hypothetical protein
MEGTYVLSKNFIAVWKEDTVEITRTDAGGMLGGHTKTIPASIMSELVKQAAQKKISSTFHKILEELWE